MIEDINDHEQNTVLRADVCIIGSGAAGITIAREFLGTRFSVIVLEAGGNVHEEASQDPYKSSLAGLQHGGIHKGRARVLGGSTTLWAGQALPLFDIDFAQRSWVPYSGWPIDKALLTPYYRRAEDVMQIPHSTNDAGTWPTTEQFPQNPDITTSYYSQFTSVPNFSRKYRADLASAPGIRLITHANVISLEANPQASGVQSVRVRSLEGHSLSVQATYFVVCCGGIESARLLLASDSVEAAGIGNRHDVVGRFFQDHPGVAVPVQPVDRKQFSAAFDSGRRDGLRYSIKIAASEAFQRKAEILHVGSEIYYPSSEEDPIAAAKDLLKTLRSPATLHRAPTQLARVLKRPDAVVRALYRRFVRGIPASVGSTTPYLGLGTEQQPNPESRVSLSSERDRLGMRRTILDWRLTASESRSILIFVEALSAEWSRSKIASINLEDARILGRENGEHGGYVDANHHIGTTRMGSDPKTSVVDRHCRVHGYSNLYIGSSSVFPTGGFSNPTLTLIALSLRIADELRGALQQAS